MENKEVLEELKETMGKAKQEALAACSNEEISDEALESVAGGVHWLKRIQIGGRFHIGDWHWNQYDIKDFEGVKNNGK
ncbi:MAG: hypothetical protein ACI3ZR_04090 [bacterium]